MTPAGPPRHAPPPGARAPARDDGVATVWAACAALLVLALVVVGVELGSAVVVRHRAEAAADLAALAAAGAAAEGEPAACARARAIAAGMDAELTRCDVVGWETFVETAATRSPAWWSGDPARGRAHAGPVESLSSEESDP